jgi:hypothetical protein
MARMFNVYGVKDGDEELVATVASAAEGKAEHQKMKAAGHYQYIRVRDCLGGLRFEFNLETGRKTA